MTTNFFFDIRDQLGEVRQAGNILGRYGYDYDGRRILKIGDDGRRQYTYDQLSVITEADQVNATVSKYDYGMDQLVRLDNRGEGRSFFHLDGLRSTVSLTDTAGGSRQSIFYDAWGNERDRIGQSANKFTFTGHEFDGETGLIYAKARFYDPDIGRFLSQDTVLGNGASPPSLHRYFYVMQNPFRYADPTGNQPICMGPECLGSSSPWRDRAISFFDFTVGFSNAFLSDLTVGLLPRIEPHLARSEAVLQGQLAGDAAAAGLGAVETAQGIVNIGTGATGGGVALATGVGAPLAIPAGVVAAVGLVQTGHGLLVLNKAVEGQAQTRQKLESRKAQTIKESPTGEEAVPQPGQEPNSGSRPTTEPAKSSQPAPSPSSPTQTKPIQESAHGGAVSSSAAASQTPAAPTTRISATRGPNEATWTVDSRGRAVEVEVTLRQDFGGTKRSSAEQRSQSLVGRSGTTGDEGGDFVAHRFIGDQGLKNLFPQNFNFNRSAFKKMENYFASQVQQGREVRYRGALRGGERPTSVGIDYEILSNGEVVESGKFRFANEAGQVF